jgi:hypothetical protein
MSTTIDVYPASDYLPAVGEIRARTQELFQRLLDKYRIESTVEVKAFSPNDGSEPIRYVDDHLRWYPGLGLGFGYWINGEWDSSSWPSCLGRDDDDVIVEEDLMVMKTRIGRRPSSSVSGGSSKNLLMRCRQTSLPRFCAPITTGPTTAIWVVPASRQQATD